MADLSGSAEMRQALAAATDPMSVTEIYAATTQVSSSTAVAAFVNVETKAGRLLRTGTAGSYRYALSADGRKALNRKVAKAIEADAELAEQRVTRPIQSVRQLIEKRTATQPPQTPQPTQPRPKAKPAPAQRRPAGHLGEILASIAHLAELHASVAAELRSLRDSLSLHRPPTGE